MSVCCPCGDVTRNASGLCDFCLDDLSPDDDYPWVYDEDEACPDTEVISVRPGEPPREITDTHLPGDADAH